MSLLLFFIISQNTPCLDRICFTQALAIAPHLSSSGIYGRAYEHLLGCYISEDPSSRFLELFEVVVIVTHGDILGPMALVLKANKLLVLAKDIRGFHCIAIGKVFFQLINGSIVLKLQWLF
jgi:hypothetical protein